MNENANKEKKTKTAKDERLHNVHDPYKVKYQTQQQIRENVRKLVQIEDELDEFEKKVEQERQVLNEKYEKQRKVTYCYNLDVKGYTTLIMSSDLDELKALRLKLIENGINPHNVRVSTYDPGRETDLVDLHKEDDYYAEEWGKGGEGIVKDILKQVAERKREKRRRKNRWSAHANGDSDDDDE